MPRRTDPFDALRRPIPPLAPRPEFAALLRRRLEQELGMTVTQDSRRDADLDGTLGLVHLRVGNADRAMAFFGALLGWEAERVVFENHISHYTVNTKVTVRILDDPDAPAVRPNYRVARVDQAVDAIRSGGGEVTSSQVDAEGGGWAFGSDDQGVPLIVYRQGRYRASVATTREPAGDVGLVFIREDASRAERFYGSVLGWHLDRVHPDSQYFDAVPSVGVFDEAAAFGVEVAPSATLYLEVPALLPALERLVVLGGSAGPHAQDMGPYYTAVCTDDQGTQFGLMSRQLE